MKAKLIKGKRSGEYLLNMEGVGYITTYESILSYKLSLKNCQAIERGYDLDELAEIESDQSLKIYPENSTSLNQDEVDRIRTIVKAQTYIGFKKGFQMALELMGDKKFSEEDMIKFSEYCLNNNDCFSDLNDNLSKFQSLQQREWDVEIEMVPALSNNGNVYYGDIPKLDENGCLILKRL